jgi:YHS domain-containing protein
MKKLGIILSIFLLAVACNNASQDHDHKTEAAGHEGHMNTEQAASPKFTADMVDNKKDFACGMPVTAGISDTLHYEGKVYGFCSKECKDEFMKDPKGYLAKQ